MRRGAFFAVNFRQGCIRPRRLPTSSGRAADRPVTHTRTPRHHEALRLHPLPLTHLHGLVNFVNRMCCSARMTGRARSAQRDPEDHRAPSVMVFMSELLRSRRNSRHGRGCATDRALSSALCRSLIRAGTELSVNDAAYNPRRQLQHAGLHVTRELQARLTQNTQVRSHRRRQIRPQRQLYRFTRAM